MVRLELVPSIVARDRFQTGNRRVEHGLLNGIKGCVLPLRDEI